MLPPMSRGGGQQAAYKQKLSQFYAMYFQKSLNIVYITHLGKASLITLVVLSEILVDSLVFKSDSAGDQ